MLEYWQLILSYLVIVLGFFVGVIIRKKTGNEVIVGKKAIILGLRAILIILSIMVLINVNNFLIFFLCVLLGVVIAYFLRYAVLFLGLLAIGFSSNTLFLLVISIIFITLLVYGTLFRYNKKRLYLNLVISILPLILFLILNIKSNETYSSILNGISLGGLLSIIIKIERYI